MDNVRRFYEIEMISNSLQDDTLTVVCEMHVFTADAPDRHTSKKGLTA